jgi:hypothetical protein
MVTTDFGSLSAQVRSIALQADGKIVVTGYAQNAQLGQTASVRNWSATTPMAASI